MNFVKKAGPALVALTCMSFTMRHARADSFTVQAFASGTTIGATAPDSVEFGDGSLWIAYTNGADSAGANGSSTVVRYSPTGSMLYSWSIAGNVDGLRVDPTSGLMWAMQNNDGNSALTVINPVTNATKSYSYGSSYTANGSSLTRGFDDVVFQNGQMFLSETNPNKGGDPVVAKLTNGLGSTPLQISGILNSTFTGTNLATGKTASTTITDPDSLVLTPSGDLAFTGEADQQIVFIHHAGTAAQSESFINLLGTNGQAIAGKPDDTAYATSTQGFFYISDTGANKVYRVDASGLAVGSVYVDVGDEFGSLNLSTGVVTPIFTGVSPHGVQFVAEAVPEPASMAYAVAGLLLCVGVTAMQRKRATVAS